MSEPIIRLAAMADIDQLVATRRDFTFEDVGAGTAVSGSEYEADAREFFRSAIGGHDWDVWAAEKDGEIVSVELKYLATTTSPMPQIASWHPRVV